jgi:hypothetical protein
MVLEDIADIRFGQERSDHDRFLAVNNLQLPSEPRKCLWLHLGHNDAPALRRILLGGGGCSW